MKSGKSAGSVRAKSGRATVGTKANGTQEVRVPIEQEQYEKLKRFKDETGFSIGYLVYCFIEHGFETKSDELLKWAQANPLLCGNVAD